MTVVLGPLPTPHPRIKALPNAVFNLPRRAGEQFGILDANSLGGMSIVHTRRRTVVGHEDEQGIVGDAKFVELRCQSANVLVDVLNHAVELIHRFWNILVGIRFRVLFVDVEWTVRSVRREVNEERSCIFFLFDKSQRIVEEDVGAVTRVFGRNPVVPVGVVEVIVVPVVGRLRNTTSTVVDYLLKAAVDWPIWIVIAKMPFAEETSVIPHIA